MFKRPMRISGAPSEPAARNSASYQSALRQTRVLAGAHAVADDTTKPVIELKQRLAQMKLARMGKK